MRIKKTALAHTKPGNSDRSLSQTRQYHDILQYLDCFIVCSNECRFVPKVYKLSGEERTYVWSITEEKQHLLMFAIQTERKYRFITRPSGPRGQR